MFMLMIDSNEFSRVVAKVSWCQALTVEMCVYVCEKMQLNSPKTQELDLTAFLNKVAESHVLED